MPLHLWRQEILKRIGDSCGGFVAIDKETDLRVKVARVRILVKVKGKTRPIVVHILEGGEELRAPDLVGNSAEEYKSIPIKGQKNPGAKGEGVRG